MSKKGKENDQISFDKNRRLAEEKDALKDDKNTREAYKEYKNYRWKEPEKLKNGPLGDESRKCRDCICFIIFIIFFIGCIIIALLGFIMGKPEKILYSYDEDGKACGLDKGYENHKMLYFYIIQQAYSHKKHIQ